MDLSFRPVQEYLAEFEREQSQLIGEYFDYLRFPSISTDSAHRNDILNCAKWVETFLSNAGLKTEQWPTNGHPVVYAEWLGAGANKPTVLIYGHYDVQPVDPLALWTTPPFEPNIRGEEVFARGAQDNKGQSFYVMAAVRAMLKRLGRLPVNLRLCIEGEEECGSSGLSKILTERRKQLQADHLLVVDFGFHSAQEPAITLGMRGLTTMTVELRGSSADLHSGVVGGIVYNPNRGLAELLAALHDSHGRVTIPGFYDEVELLSSEEEACLSFDFHEEQFRAAFGAEATGGEKDLGPLKRAWIRPTAEINGISGGYSGEGFKTVIPAVATAKLSFRLVPRQSPAKIADLVETFLRENTPPGLSLTVHHHPGRGEAVRSSPTSETVRVTAEVFRELHNEPCRFILSGGSVPVIAELSKISGADAAMIGFGLPEDNIHAPDEHFGINRLKQGYALISGLLERFGG